MRSPSIKALNQALADLGASMAAKKTARRTVAGACAAKELDSIRTQLSNLARSQPAYAGDVEAVFERAASVGWTPAVTATARRLLAEAKY